MAQHGNFQGKFLITLMFVCLRSLCASAGFSERQLLRGDFLKTKSSTELCKRLSAFLDFSKTLGQDDKTLSGLDQAVTLLASDMFLRHKSEASFESALFE